MQADWGGDITGYEKLFKSANEIEKDIQDIKNTLWEYETDNAEVFQQQISEIKDKGLLQKIAKALKLAYYKQIIYLSYHS